MIRRKPVRALLLVAAASTAMLGLQAVPASASTSTCTIGEFPATQASQSAAKIACTFTNSATPSLNEVSTSFTLHDFQNASYHIGAARKVTTTAAVAIGGTVLTAAAGHFTAADINHPVAALNAISGAAVVPARAFITAVTATTATINVPAAVAIPVGTVVSIDNDTARTVADGVTTAGSTTVTSAKAHFLAADVGKTIGASNIPEYKTIATVVNATTVTISAAATTSGTAQVLNIGGSTAVTSTRSVIDATQTATGLTSLTAKFGPTDVGLPVTGTGIAANSYITAVAANTATVTPAMTPNAVAHNIVIGVPSISAPTNGAPSIMLGTILDLNPALVAGFEACSLNKANGIAIGGGWQNPGSFVTTGVLGAQPAGITIAQVLFKTSVTSFAGYIQKVATDTAKPVAHYDVVFPLLPTTLAACPAPNAVNITSTFTIQAIAANQSALPTGVGRPSASQMRYLAPNNGVAAATTAIFKSNVATVPKNWSFTGSCTMAAIPASNFQCGN